MANLIHISDLIFFGTLPVQTAFGETKMILIYLIFLILFI